MLVEIIDRTYESLDISATKPVLTMYSNVLNMYIEELKRDAYTYTPEHKYLRTKRDTYSLSGVLTEIYRRETRIGKWVPHTTHDFYTFVDTRHGVETKNSLVAPVAEWAGILQGPLGSNNVLLRAIELFAVFQAEYNIGFNDFSYWLQEWVTVVEPSSVGKSRLKDAAKSKLMDTTTVKANDVFDTAAFLTTYKAVAEEPMYTLKEVRTIFDED